MENISNALRTLRLPDSLWEWNGQITHVTRRQLVERVVTDFTKMVSGKPTVTTTYEVIGTKSLLGNYGLNMLSMYIHSFDFEYVDSTSLNLPWAVYTIQAGPFKGQTYWRGNADINMVKTPTGFRFIHKYFPFNNTTRTGYPEPTNGNNPSISIKRESITKTATFTSKPSVSYPSYTKDQILQKTGYSIDVFMECFASVYDAVYVNHETHITSTSTGIEVTDGNKYSGKVYINGLLLDTEINPSGLRTSYGSTWPGLVKRWKLYNGAVNESIYGSTWVKKYSRTENSDIIVNSGTTFSYDDAAKTLTYNSSVVPTNLWFEFEELPAQGKNWSSETIMELYS